MKTSKFNADRLAEVKEKCDVYYIYSAELIIMDDLSFDTLQYYVGLREFEHKDMQMMMEEDEEISIIVKPRGGFHANSRCRIPIGNVTMSIVQGHLMYTDSIHEYEVGLLTEDGLMECKEFYKMDIPKGMNLGDYSYCYDGCHEHCGSCVIGHMSFEDLCKLICAVTVKYHGKMDGVCIKF